MTVSASDAGTVLISCGGYRDSLGALAALAKAAGAIFVEVSGGGTLSAGDFALVTDSSGVSLPASPVSGDFCIVLNSTSAGNCLVSGNGKNINGQSGDFAVGMSAIGFTYNGTEWNT